MKLNKQSLLAASSLLGGLTEVSEMDLVMTHKPIDHHKQAVWFRKVMQRPQKSRHNRTKRGRK